MVFREDFEEWLVWGTFYLFMISCLYLFLKRFYFNELVGLAYSIIETVLEYLYYGINYVIKFYND